MSSKIAVIYGKDIEKMTRTLMEKTMPEISRSSSIVLKPNLVTLSSPEEGATTHTSIVETVIEYLQDEGFKDITIAEGSWVGASTEECYRKLGYYSIRDRYGVKLVDHAMKNLKGCLSDKSKRDFHRLGLDTPIAVLNSILHPGLTISDSICGDLDFEEGGNPVETDRMMASTDPIALDAYASTLMGYTPEDIGYIREAIALGIAKSPEWEVEELSKPVSASAKPNGTVKQLSAYTAPVEACSACYASLIRALKILGDEGGLRKLGNKKIAIGQGYRNASPELGAGLCCRNAVKHAGGCPASAKDILEMLRSIQ